MKNIKLYSNSEEINTLLENYRKNIKEYSKLLEILKILGNIYNKIQVELYDINEDKENKRIRLCFIDNSDNLFIFCPYSTTKNDRNKIKKITNDFTFTYDISLSKKFLLDKENINLIQCDEIYNTKFGRLITNNKTYYNLFLGNDICYQILIQNKDKNIEYKNIIEELNKLENAPKFKEYVNLIEKILLSKNIEFKKIELSVFQKFEKISGFSVDNENLEQQETKNYKKIKKL